jgi:hypothetical protein
VHPIDKFKIFTRNLNTLRSAKLNLSGTKHGLNISPKPDQHIGHTCEKKMIPAYHSAED